MTRFFRVLIRAEITAALHVAALGEWWAERAVRRLGKFSGKYSEKTTGQ